MPNACTIVISNYPRTVCGKPAEVSFVGRMTGETFYECSEHAFATDEHCSTDFKVGDHVCVSRYGKTYYAIVTKVGARGAAYATFIYNNGAERTVRV